MKIALLSSTSTNKKKYVENKVMDYLKSQQVEMSQIEFTQHNIYTAKKEEFQDADLLLVIGTLSVPLDIPIIDGTAFIARVPSLEETVCQEILSFIQGKGSF